MSRFFGMNAAIFLVLVLMMNVGGVFSAGMMMDDNGMMHNCPYMGIAALCNMSPLEHLSQWQSMFSATLLLFALAFLWHMSGQLITPPDASSAAMHP